MQPSGLPDNDIYIQYFMISQIQLGNNHGHSVPLYTRMTGAHSRHVFHLVDARNHKLLPGDKQLLHLLAKAQRRSVRYTIVTGWCTIDIDVDRASNFNDVRKKMWSDKVLYINIVYAYTRCIC